MTDNPYLSGNFAPVEEEVTSLGLSVTGQIPNDLRGRLLRIGPNPIEADPASHHWYGYTATFSANGDFGGLLKHDLRGGRSETHSAGATRKFLEPVFVPRGIDAAEDDGWIMAYVYDAATNGGDVVILHAQDFAADPVATIHLPQRVPFGFDGNWVPDQA